MNDSKAFVECSNDMDDIYKNIEEYNPNKKYKVVIVLLIWLLKIIIFSKVPNKQVLQQIAFNHSSHVDIKDFMNLYKNIIENHILFSVIDATVASDSPLSFRKSLSERI